MHKPQWTSLNLSPDTSLGRNSKFPYTGSLSPMACPSLPGHAIYISQCQIINVAAWQMVMVMVTSTSISARRSRPRGSWQGDSDILISFEGCNLFREKKFLVLWKLRDETIPIYVKCNISITLIQLWNKAKVINCNLRFRAVFDWISKNQNQSNHKGQSDGKKIPLRANENSK